MSCSYCDEYEEEKKGILLYYLGLEGHNLVTSSITCLQKTIILRG